MYVKYYIFLIYVLTIIFYSKQQLLIKETQNLDKSSSYIEAGCCILNYVADIMNAVCPQKLVQDRATSPPWEGAQPCNDITDSEWIDEIAHDEDDSGAEDSDEDSLCNKLCTFTITQKEFMNQHWYHCHTCNMVDGVGVCSVCARVCHRGHDVTYAKYGNFFCDCGAKEDTSCLALTKRSPQSSEHPTTNGTTFHNANANSDNQMLLTSSLRRRASSPVHFNEKHERSTKDKQKQQALAKQLGNFTSFNLIFIPSGVQFFFAKKLLRLLSYIAKKILSS
jgi:E3 ubiquitin-protein ligase UBR4